MTDNSDRIERTLELLLYAPLGVGLFLKDTAPQFVDMFVSRGRAEVDRRHEEVQQRVTTARSLGQVAMAFGPPIVRERVGRTVADARRTVEGLLGSSAGAERPAPTPAPSEASSSAPSSAPSATAPENPPAPAPAPGYTTRTSAVRAPKVDVGSSNGGPLGNGDGTESAELPIPGYDALSASQVVQRLVGLSADELAAVHAYEATHRQRRTILGKIEQLAG
ncbi:MAG: hypothetical protein QOI08_713 [Actinomycetota bacterium]|jgi:hypothetical protein|nr:hypothetical protein [Actinomycetota bacterium]